MSDQHFDSNELLMSATDAATREEASVCRQHNVIEAYLTDLMLKLRVAVRPQYPVKSIQDPEMHSTMIFIILTGREFCYLGRARSARYQEQVVASLGSSMRNGEPLRFYYDLGGGYHASIRPGESELIFDVGLAELFVLSQVVSFCKRASEVYPLGAKFYLVIDNICALMTNDIPIEKTSAYCARLRTLVRETGLEGTVEVLVESERFCVSDYEVRGTGGLESVTPDRLSGREIENVQRFLGRRCNESEAAERIMRYRQASGITDGMFGQIIQGVHMTQRATGETLGFRAFPGGDSRIQCGEVAISRNRDGRLRPVLLTSRNVNDFCCGRLQYPSLLPSTIQYVTYAERIRQ